MLRVDQQVSLGVGVCVDEAGRDCQSCGVDHPTCLGARKVADRFDGLSRDADVSSICGCLSAVHDTAADYENVEHRISPEVVDRRRLAAVRR